MPADPAREVILAYANDWHGANCEGNFRLDAACSCGLAEQVAAIEVEARAEVLAEVEGLHNPYDREHDAKKQPFVGPAAVGYEAARAAVRALLAVAPTAESRPLIDYETYDRPRPVAPSEKEDPS